MQTLQNKVTARENKVETPENKVKYLESDLEVSKNTSTVLSKELDKLQEYSRRNCPSMSCIPVKKNETMNDIKMTVYSHHVTYALQSEPAL